MLHGQDFGVEKLKNNNAQCLNGVTKRVNEAAGNPFSSNNQEGIFGSPTDLPVSLMAGHLKRQTFEPTVSAGTDPCLVYSAPQNALSTDARSFHSILKKCCASHSLTKNLWCIASPDVVLGYGCAESHDLKCCAAITVNIGKRRNDKADSGARAEAFDVLQLDHSWAWGENVSDRWIAEARQAATPARTRHRVRKRLKRKMNTIRISR